MDIRTVGVMWNPKKSAGLPVARRVINVLEEHAVALRLDAGLASAFRRESAESFADCDLLCVLGGDGTLLSALDVAIPYDIPMLGVDLGRVGFLSEVEPDDLEEDFERLFAGEGFMENRMIMEIEGEDSERMFALNEISVMRRGQAVGILSLELEVNGTLLDRISGDGLIGVNRLFAFGGRADCFTGAGLLRTHAGMPAYHERAAFRGLRGRPHQRSRVGRRLCHPCRARRPPHHGTFGGALANHHRQGCAQGALCAPARARLLRAAAQKTVAVDALISPI